MFKVVYPVSIIVFVPIHLSAFLSTNNFIVATCPDLGHCIENGNVSYTRHPTEQGRYVENTTVTVSCDKGYGGGGDITCQHDGTWSSASLLNCTSEPDIISVTVTCLEQSA